LKPWAGQRVGTQVGNQRPRPFFRSVRLPDSEGAAARLLGVRTARASEPENAFRTLERECPDCRDEVSCFIGFKAFIGFMGSIGFMDFIAFGILLGMGMLRNATSCFGCADCLANSSADRRSQPRGRRDASKVSPQGFECRTLDLDLARGSYA
jgi:hypothetical protein